MVWLLPEVANNWMLLLAPVGFTLLGMMLFFYGVKHLLKHIS